MNMRQIGARYEGVAVSYLQKKGYRILKRNFRCRQGEIDIVAMDGRTLVFAEVKYRHAAGSGFPEEAVDGRKQRVICRAAAFFCSRYRVNENIPCRFDVIAVAGDAVRHYENAFDFVL